MIKALISIRIKSFLGSFGSKKRGGTDKSKGLGLIGKGLVVLLLLSVFLIYFFVIAFTMASALVPRGLDSLYFGIFLTLSLALIFLLSIFETKSELFECKDNELLLSMPIKPSHIVISRLFSVLIYNYAEGATVILPCVVAYAAVGGGARGVLGALLVSLFIPLLATALASGVGYIVALITKRLKKSSFFTVAVSLVLLGLYFLGYSYFTSGMEMIEQPDADISAVTQKLGALGYIGSAALFHPMYTTALIAFSLVAAAIAYLVISRSYISIITDNRGARRTEYKAKRLQRGGAFSALVKKELKRFFSSAAYILNAGLGVVLLVAAAVFLLIKSESVMVLVSSLGLSDGAGTASSLVISALCVVLSTNFISAAALSLEGGSLWIIKTMPVSARTVLFAKAMPHVIVALPSSLIASVLAMIAVKAPPSYFVFFILTPILFNLLGAFVGIFFNTLFPKFDYENEVQVIKQSASTFVTMLVMMLFGLITVGMNLAISIFVSALLASLLTLVLVLILASLFAALIAGPISRRYESFCA